MADPVFDYPTAWAVMDQTVPDNHHEHCSYRTQDRALLCDCAALAAAVIGYHLAYKRILQAIEGVAKSDGEPVGGRP